MPGKTKRGSNVYLEVRREAAYSAVAVRADIVEVR